MAGAVFALVNPVRGPISPPRPFFWVSEDILSLSAPFTKVDRARYGATFDQM